MITPNRSQLTLWIGFSRRQFLFCNPQNTPIMNALRTNIQNLTVLSAVIAFASCESHKQSTITESGTEVVKLRQPEKDTLPSDKIPTETKSVSGLVKDIKNGKDGYTAQILSPNGQTYFVTVSHANLNDHKTFRTVEIGEVLSATGDFWKLEDTNQITARQLD